MSAIPVLHWGLAQAVIVRRSLCPAVGRIWGRMMINTKPYSIFDPTHTWPFYYRAASEIVFKSYTKKKCVLVNENWVSFARYCYLRLLVWVWMIFLTASSVIGRNSAFKAGLSRRSRGWILARAFICEFITIICYWVMDVTGNFLFWTQVT